MTRKVLPQFIKLLPVLAGTLLFGTFSNAYSQSTATIGELNSYDRQDGSAILKSEGEGKVKITPLSRDVIRVRVSKKDTFRRNNGSYAVVNDTLGTIPELKIEDAGDHWLIRSGNVQLQAAKSPFSLTYKDNKGNLLGSDAEGPAYQWQGQQWTWRRTIRSDEKIIGLGEKAGSLVRNGGTYTMWNSDHPCYSTTQDPLYKSIPFYMSSKEYGVFLDNTYKTTFDVGETKESRLTVTGAGGPLIYYVIKGGDYKKMIDKYTQLTGRPMLPPKWAFGYAQCKGFYTNEEITRSVANTLRDHKIPADIIYQDIGWVDELQNFQWDPEDYEDPEKMLSDLEDQGFKVVVSQDPIISRRNKEQWSELAQKDLLVLDERTGEPYDMPWPWGGPGGLVDFTKEEAADYWGELQQQVVDQGVDGFWTDMGEPAWSNLEDTSRLHMQHEDGPHAEIHNVYGHTWDQVVTSQWRKRNDNRRIFQMTRAAFAGMQRFTFSWSGDAGCEENILNGWDRLEDQIRIAQSSGLGGLAFWSSDISGYCGDIEDYEAFAPLYVRWMQFGMFNSLSRVHHNGDWAVEPWQFGPEIEDMVRKAVERRYRLFPYIYTYARESFDSGLPMMRSLALEYPDDQNSLKADTQFLFGRELLVAPVVSDTTARKIYLPEGAWIDYSNPSKRVEGNQWITEKAELDETPIWVKEGSIIPKMPLMQYIHENPDYPIILNVYPHRTQGKTADFELYEDDGLTYDYEGSKGSRTRYSVKTTKDGWVLKAGARRNSGDYSPSERNLVFKVHIPDRSEEFEVINTISGTESVDKRALTKILDFEGDLYGWSVEPARDILYIKTPDTGNQIEFRVRVTSNSK